MVRRKHYIYYDDDFKATAVKLSELPGVLAKHVAESLDIHEVMLYRWRMEKRRGQIVTNKKSINIDPLPGDTDSLITLVVKLQASPFPGYYVSVS